LIIVIILELLYLDLVLFI